jgi:glutaredoxin
VNVVAEPARLKEMLKHSKGKRSVPVIVDGDSVSIGFGGS